MISLIKQRLLVSRLPSIIFPLQKPIKIKIKSNEWLLSDQNLSYSQKTKIRKCLDERNLMNVSDLKCFFSTGLEINDIFYTKRYIDRFHKHWCLLLLTNDRLKIEIKNEDVFCRPKIEWIEEEMNKEKKVEDAVTKAVIELQESFRHYQSQQLRY